MKKLLKCLCLLLVVPIVSVFALTGCKDKNEPTPSKYMSCEDIEKVINSAFISLYGDDVPALPPQYDDPIGPEDMEEDEPSGDETPDGPNDGSDPVPTPDPDPIPDPVPVPTPVAYGSTANASSSSGKIKVNESNFLYNSLANKTQNFSTLEGANARLSDGAVLDLNMILKTPLTIARSLVALDNFDCFKKTMSYSYAYAEDIYPDNIDCKIRITVYETSLFIECHTLFSEEEFESYFVNISFDSKYAATKIMYCLSSEYEDSDDLFCFAIYDIAADTTVSMNYSDTSLSNTIETLKSSIKTFKNSTGSTDDSVSLYSIYKLLNTF